MNFDIDFESIVNPCINKLKPYQPGKPIESLQRELNISEVIKLASNENPLGPNPKVLKQISKELKSSNIYPDGSGYELKNILSKKHLQQNIKINNITLGNGSDEIFTLLLRCFLKPEEEVIISEYAFAAYAIAAKAQNANLIIAKSKNWGCDLDEIKNSITEKTKIIFIANPNNPTGTWLSKNELEKFIQEIPSNILVVIDQAYFEYMQDYTDYPDAANWVNKFSNLIVTFTFSKAYGLAGLRIGYSLSHPKIADLMNRIRLPFNNNIIALKAASIVLEENEYIKKVIELTRSGMCYLSSQFEQMGLSFIATTGNFITIDVNRPAMSVYEELLQKGVIVRPLLPYRMERHLRVTIGKEQENIKFINALKSVLK